MAPVHPDATPLVQRFHWFLAALLSRRGVGPLTWLIFIFGSGTLKGGGG